VLSRCLSVVTFCTLEQTFSQGICARKLLLVANLQETASPPEYSEWIALYKFDVNLFKRG